MEQTNEISIELAAAIRNATVWMSNAYSHERVKRVSESVRNLALDSIRLQVPAWDQRLCDVHSRNKFDCDRTMSALAFLRNTKNSARGIWNGESSSPVRAASCAELHFIQTQEIVSRNQAASLYGDALGDLSGRPASLLAELRDPAVGDTDQSRKVATLDAGGFEVCG